ncbi:sensor histidine kinase [Deinococcus aquaedulcis]|uniref:sensor histidine kinase n=1 Tax=Deinococcus aquaedulcis TaxID=2840455 RepID=UPI002E2A3C8F|nr:HAMP domain-containing sensor histidine kinase [Deinococcus aquaedulcis]
MTLRWRLTLFYTALLAFLLTAVGLITLYLMRANLIGGLDRELDATYRQFVSYVINPLKPNEPRLPLDRLQRTARERTGDPEISQAKLLARFYFPDSSLALENLSFYTRQSLIDDLAGARTPDDRAKLFRTIETLRSGTRRSLAVDVARPITLSREELEQLINSVDGRLTLNRTVYVSANSEPVPMRLLVVLGPLKPPAPKPDPGSAEDAPKVAAEEDAAAPQASPGDLLGGGSLSTYRLDAPEDESVSLVYVARDLRTVEGLLNQLEKVLLLLFITGLLTAGTGAYALAGQALQPLRRVQRAAERIGGQNLTERVPVPQTGDEVESLAMALNAMLGRLEGSFEAQRRFTSDASHELRTPVTAISGHASYLLRRTNPSGQQAESLRIIQRESERLTNLIASLLQLARSDSGALAITREPILAALFLFEITQELAPLAQAQGTALRTEGEDVTFEGDPDRLKQVLINLVSNALKAGAQTITLRSARLGDEVRLSVQDDGPGIPADQLERLFDRFYRLEDSRSRDQGGAGLGLSIARGIVDAHGGRIWLESEVGAGTTAHVQLPIGNVPELGEEDVP